MNAERVSSELFKEVNEENSRGEGVGGCLKIDDGVWRGGWLMATSIINEGGGV